MNTVILVPRRDDNGYRDELWSWCQAWWEREQSHMPIVEGYHADGLFNRSAAINTAARIAGDWDVAVIIDADVTCSPDRVKSAVELAARTGRMILPHSTRYDLSRKASELVRRGAARRHRGRGVHRAPRAPHLQRREWAPVGVVRCRRQPAPVGRHRRLR